MPYEPTPEDIEWAKALIEFLTEGGVWVWPAIGIAYKLRHQIKTIECVNPELLGSSTIRAYHRRTIAVWGKLEWTVLPSEEDLKEFNGD
jgi:hypothetical protein